jgi:hypothetical protein
LAQVTRSHIELADEIAEYNYAVAEHSGEITPANAWLAPA